MNDLVNPVQQSVGALAVIQRAQPEWVWEPRPRVAGLLGAVGQAQLAPFLRGQMGGQRSAKRGVGAGEEDAHAASWQGLLHGCVFPPYSTCS